MDRDTIIRLAREAGLEYSCQDGWTSPTPENKYPEAVEQEPLERFAALVAAHEREECANIALTGTGEAVQLKTLEIIRAERERIADAIRSRT